MGIWSPNKRDYWRGKNWKLCARSWRNWRTRTSPKNGEKNARELTSQICKRALVTFLVKNKNDIKFDKRNKFLIFWGWNPDVRLQDARELFEQKDQKERDELERKGLLPKDKRELPGVLKGFSTKFWWLEPILSEILNNFIKFQNYNSSGEATWRCFAE